jgi:formylglycine-generating enzyme required for sulfatase activity/dienelactone hydrolase/predicted Ser/Thr protein kinase
VTKSTRDQLRLTAALADRYRLERELGEGGMATVHLAEDLKHHRKVALKVLKPELAAILGAERFLREIEITANLQHPHILPLFDSGEADGFLFYVMPYVQGESLRDLLARTGRMDVTDALRMTSQLALALDAAHRQGILHRDIKPENILVRDGQPVIADFGIALATSAGSGRLTEVGVSVGTALYMSPEQATGERELDARCDLYSLACVLYEMVVGVPPHQGTTAREVITARLLGPPDMREVRRIMPALAPVLAKALAPAPADRQPTMAVFAAALQELLDSATARARAPFRPAVLIAAAVAVVALALGWTAWRARAQQEREGLLSRIEMLSDSADMTGAVLLAKHLGEADDTENGAGVELWRRIARPVVVRTDPAGARASWRALTGDTSWQELGTTPTDTVWLPRSLIRLRLEREGAAPFEVNTWPLYRTPLADGEAIRLPAPAELPPGMVLVGGGKRGVGLPGLEGLPELQLPEYLIDRFETTNRQFKEFVDAGGYADSSWWPQLERDRRAVSWADGRRAFVDRTGRPGPSTWELGSYTEGLAEHPVAGVSWFEAAAYARFRGRSLPSVYHWSTAAGTWAANWTVPSSNFSGEGTAPVGRFTGLGPWGTLDMAGNVREWCANASGRERFIVGGGWNDAEYMFTDANAQSPWDRSVTNGIRLASYPTETDGVRAALGPIQRPHRDFLHERQASDAEFAVFRRLYAYDPRPLDSRIEAADTTEEWIRQRVSFTAAYGDERLPAYLFLPRRGTPPFQTVVHFPGSSSLFQRSFDDGATAHWDFLPKGGRAFLFPLYWGTFERMRDVPTDQPDTTTAYRDRVGLWAKDFQRAVDYAVSRPELDSTRIAYYGHSWGGRLGPLMLALEPRIKVAVLYVAGLKLQRSLPEADPFNYAPRVRIPVLMVNARLDFLFPIETSQTPLYRLLGSPADAKHHAVYDGAHTVPRAVLMRETQDWLDRWLGPVTP